MEQDRWRKGGEHRRECGHRRRRGCKRKRKLADDGMRARKKRCIERNERRERGGRGEREQKIKAAGLRVAEDPRGGKSPARERRK